MAHESKLKKIQSSARELRMSTSETRNKVLLKAAEFLIEEEDSILKANLKDLKKLSAEVSPAFKDRLTLNPQRLAAMAESLRQVAELPDPLAVEGEKRVLKNGLQLKKVRAPLGVIFMIFESRPNVAIEAFSMGFKSGNAMILRGGKESQYTVAVLYKILQTALKHAGLSADSFWGITDPDRKLVNFLLKQREYIDVVVPRGGEGLINFVVNNSLIPIIKNDRGLCHVYVHDDADLAMAVNIIVNAKTQRPAVCNSMETMLIHASLAEQLIPMMYQQMQKFQVKWYGDAKTLKILKGSKNVKKATEKNWNTEYSDQIVNCKVVSSLEEAMAHIDKYGSKHSEAIVTDDAEVAEKFQKKVDAAVVYWNASTRFTDGFEFGLGGELGISTQKLHVRGPVGLQALTNERWIATGTGQVR